MQSTIENRSLFDWGVFTIIHLILIAAIGYAGFHVYGVHLGGWVAASASIAGLVSTYLFAKIVPGETLMKVVLGLCVAANAGYLVHNGARSLGIEAYNDGQLRRYEIGMAEASRAGTRRMAAALALGAKSASDLEKAFGDGVSLIAAILAFLELASGIVIFSIASKRVSAINRATGSQSTNLFPAEIEAGK